MSNKLLKGLLLAGTTAVATGGFSSANSSGLEEIVVTAQRKSENLKDVGIAISAFSGDTLKNQGVTSSIEIAKFTPGVNISGTLGGQGMQFSIRGVTQSDYNDAIEAPVAVYVDDSYISSQQGQGMALFDIERVEVLKGPQGTLFGRNATGGLVHFIVKKPDFDSVSGFVDVSYGSFEKATFEGAVNLPVGSNLAMRLSTNWTKNGSIWKNDFSEGMVQGAPLNFGPEGVSPAGEDLGDEETLSGRFQLLWQINDETSARLTTSSFDQDLSESPWTSRAVLPVLDSSNRVIGGEYATGVETRAAIGPNGENFFDPSVIPFQGFLFSPNNDGQRSPGATTFGYVPVDAEDKKLSKDFAQSDLNKFRATNTALHINASFENFDVVSVTSLSGYNKHFLLDADGSPVNGFLFGTKAETDTFSQEIRISGGNEGFTWVTGLYYLDITADVATGLLAPKGSALAAVFGGSFVNTGVDPLSIFKLETESTSIFGQVSWEFAPRWTLVTGGRLIKESQNYEYASSAMVNVDDYSVDPGVTLFPLYPDFKDDRSDSLWAAKVQFEYRPNDDFLLYLGVNRGVKGGSYNGKIFDGSAPLAASDIPYDPEELVSIEGGFKLSGDLNGGNPYTLNGSIYHYDYKNYQSFTFSDISGFVRSQDANTIGAELEATVLLGESILLSASGAITDAEVENLEVAPGVIRNTEPTFTPKYTANARINYTVPREIAGGSLDIGAVVTYSSEFYHNSRNFDSQLYDSYTLLDFNARWELDNGFHLGTFVKNATDKRYSTVGLDLATACGCNLEAYGMPRTIGISVGYEF